MIVLDKYMIMWAITIIIVYIIQHRYFSLKKTENDMRTLSMQLHIDIGRKAIIELLDDFIEEVLNDYLAQHAKYVTCIYISKEMQNTMVSEITTMISERMPPYLYQRLSLIYNENAIAEVIANKVMLLVSTFISDRNVPKATNDE